jgi:hypothetical protein
MTGRPIVGEPVDVEHQPVAEVLPILYRAVLDAVASLEARGLRREAATIRADATEAYSGAWSPAAVRRLTNLRERADKVLHGRRGPGRRTVVVESLDRRVDLERTTV